MSIDEKLLTIYYTEKYLNKINSLYWCPALSVVLRGLSKNTEPASISGVPTKNIGRQWFAARRTLGGREFDRARDSRLQPDASGVHSLVLEC